MKEQKKIFRFSLLALAFVFLFNPNLNIVDILPDFIGYALLCIFLSKLSDMNEDIAVATKGFLRAFFVDVAKLASIFLVFGNQNPQELNTLLLLLSFVFAVLELLILFPAYKALFNGFITLGYKFPNTAVLGKVSANAKANHTERARLFTFIFLIVKTAMYTLPEFAVLSTHSYDEFAATLYIYDYVGLLRAFAIIVCLVVGIIWFVHIRAYFSRLAKDKEFTSALVDDYKINVLPKESLFIRKSVRLISLIFVVAAVLCIDFRLDSYNVLVDTIPAIILIALALATQKHIGKLSKSIVPFAVYAVASLVAIIFEYGFFNEYYYGAIWRNDEAFYAYRVMLAFAVVDAVAFLVAAFGMVNILRHIISNYTGFSVPGSSINVGDKVKKVQDTLTKKTCILYAAAVLAAMADLFYDFFAASINFAGLINVVGSLVFVVAVISVTSDVREEVESKYMLE